MSPCAPSLVDLGGGRPTPLLLATSGGRDSMALLHAVAASPAHGRIAVVATFDHATGLHAREAVHLVRATCAKLRLPLETATAPHGLRTEAALRAARWAFLRAAAARHHAAIVTAHTDDDQVETVLMRVMRHAGARGLAALYADSDILRPLLHVTRAEISAYIEEHDIAYIEDPTNQDQRYFRNRIRHDLLPALVRVDPRLPDRLRRIAREAAAWRREVDAVIEQLPIRTRSADAAQASSSPRGSTARPTTLTLAARALTPFDPSSLRILWPAIAARIGATLDRRGTIRLTQFTERGTAGSRIQLSGGWEVFRGRDEMVLRRAESPVADAEQPLTDMAELGRFRFRVIRDTGAAAADLWSAALPVQAELTVRSWQPGDRMRPSPGSPPRRVKRFLSDARIAGPDRAEWPVVLADGKIVWIPGVRRGVLDGTPRDGTTRAYVCDYIER